MQQNIPLKTKTKANKKSHTTLKLFTVADIIIFILVIGITTVLFMFTLTKQTANAQVEISTDEGKFLYPLSQNNSIIFNGPLGKTYVEISNNSVSVTESPGKQRICIKAGAISKNGQWLACLPNKVFLRIVGGAPNTESSSVDIISF